MTREELDFMAAAWEACRDVGFEKDHLDGGSLQAIVSDARDLVNRLKVEDDCPVCDRTSADEGHGYGCPLDCLLHSMATAGLLYGF